MDNVLIGLIIGFIAMCVLNYAVLKHWAVSQMICKKLLPTSKA